MIEFDEQDGAPAPRREFETTIPLINVVFLLLIFFLLAGTLGETSEVGVNLPSGTIDDPAPPQKVTLYVEADGFVWVGDQVMEPSLAGFMLKDFMRDKDKSRVSIKADQAAPAESVLTLMEGLRGAGVQQVTLLTERGS